MSKTVSSIFGSGSGKTKGYESEVINFLNNYDTSNKDNTLSNLGSTAHNWSKYLSDNGVDGSDAARQRAEAANYNSYMDKYRPEFEKQTSDLQSRLVNQGLAPGGEAYQRATTDLLSGQNDAMQQAAYNSVKSGQDAYSQSLGDQGNYINQILALLSGTPSGYEKAMDKYGIQSGIQARKTNEINSGWGNLGALSGAAAGAFMGK